MIYGFTLPLAVAISLVYAASRHEGGRAIFRHAAKLFLTIVAFLLISTLILAALNTQV